MTTVDVEALSPRAKEKAQQASLRFRCVERAASGALLEVALETGRKHQIRVQLSARNWPIVGDRRYGSRRAFAEGIALHARSIRFRHPTRDETLTIEAPAPAAWRELGYESVRRS